MEYVAGTHRTHLACRDGHDVEGATVGSEYLKFIACVLTVNQDNNTHIPSLKVVIGQVHDKHDVVVFLYHFRRSSGYAVASRGIVSLDATNQITRTRGRNPLGV